MESNNSGSSVAALTGAMMRPEVEVTHHYWVEVTLGLRVCYRWRWRGLRVKKTNHSPPYNNALTCTVTLCVS